MSTEAMKLALRSLKELVPDDSDHTPAIQGQRKRQENALKALQKALAQPQQEPVAWVFRRSLIQKFRWHRDKPVGQEALLYWEPLYTSPPARKPLTDEEIDWMTRGNNYPGTVPGARRFARAIEAKHGIKGDA